MGYHVRDITKGTIGEFSKIREEYEELLDSVEQNNIVMSLLECSDLIGAIELYALNFNITLK